MSHCVSSITTFLSPFHTVLFMLFFFFFQAEDGIRDVAVTGVQTCALPIWLEQDVGFHADDVAEQVSQPDAAPDLTGKAERGIVARVGAERSDFNLPGVLRCEASRGERQPRRQQPEPSHVSSRARNALKVTGAARRAGFARAPRPSCWARSDSSPRTPSSPCGPVRRPCSRGTRAPRPPAPAIAAGWSWTSRCCPYSRRSRSGSPDWRLATGRRYPGP